MIQIDRGDEPPELAESRRSRLAKAALHVQKSGPPPPSFTGYDVADVKERLWKAQLRKCAFCERPQGLENQPIEHFRPKAQAEHHLDDKSSISRAHYWWLAWTWENLFFACTHCNGQALKGNRFPILGLPLKPWDFDLAKERGLVDPATMDPLDHIQWAPRRQTGPREHWDWHIVPKSDEGKNTIAVFGWKKETIGVEVAHHLRTEVLDKYCYVQSCLSGARLGAWYTLRQRLLTGYARYQNATWCALECWRQLDGATLPALQRPGRARPFAVPTGLPPSPGGVSDTAWWSLLAGAYNEAIIEICRGCPSDLASLTALFREADAPKARIKGLAEDLARCVGAGELVQVGGLYSVP